MKRLTWKFERIALPVIQITHHHHTHILKLQRDRPHNSHKDLWKIFLKMCFFSHSNSPHPPNSPIQYMYEIVFKPSCYLEGFRDGCLSPEPEQQCYCTMKCGRECLHHTLSPPSPRIIHRPPTCTSILTNCKYFYFLYCRATKKCSCHRYFQNVCQSFMDKASF